MLLSDCMAVMVIDPVTQKSILVYKKDDGTFVQIVGGKDGQINLREFPKNK